MAKHTLSILINGRGTLMSWAERLIAINIGLCLDSGIAILEASVTIDWAAYGIV
jgi:hypothetical protein